MVETFVQSTDDVVKFLKGQHNLIKDMFDDVLSASSREAREKAFIALRQLLGRARDRRGDGGPSPGTP